MRKLILALLLLMASHLARAQAQGPFYISVAGTNGASCAQISVGQDATISISVTGTWTGTLTPQVTIYPNPPVNTVVFPVGSNTSQATITANGIYSAQVAAMSTFQVCATTLSSGTVVVYLQGSNAVNAGFFAGAGGGGTVTAVTASSPITSSGGTAPNIACPTCVTSVSGTANQINSTGGTAPVLSLSSTIVLPGTLTVPSGTSISATGTGTIAATSVPLNGVSSANGTATINNLNFPITWNWAQTTDAQDGLAFGESAAATGGTLTNGLANQALNSISTLAGSTETPLEIQQGSVTGTVAFPAIQIETTWNNAGLTGQGIFFNVTNTSSAAASLLENLQVNNATVFSVGVNGGALATGPSTFSYAPVASSSAVTVSGAPFTGGTGTTTFPLFYQNTTGATAPTTWSTSGTFIGVNAPSGFVGNFIDLHVNGTVSGFVVNNNALNIGASNTFLWTGRSRITSPVDGVINLTNQASTSFTRLDFGGITSTFPAFGFSGTTITAQLADGTAGGTFSASNYATVVNCAAVGTAANPSVASCTSATAGSVSCATGATTCTVNTTGVTANSEIFISQREDTTTGTRLGVTCNVTPSTVNANAITAVVAGTSFSFALTAPVTNPDCFSYHIIN